MYTKHTTSSQQQIASIRSQSISKLIDHKMSMNGQYSNNNNNNGALKAMQSALSLPLGQAKPNSDSSSPLTNRSDSISSLDDNGFYGSTSSPAVEYVYPRKRLYQSVPNRKFLCIKSYKPIQMGELDVKKGDILEILSVGEQGFWEGKNLTTGNEGWFPSDCIEEIQDSNGNCFSS
jgi:hypothetical protein